MAENDKNLYRSRKGYLQPIAPGAVSTVILGSSSITGVPNGIETTLLTHTTIGGTTVGDVVMSGTDYARFNFYLNTVLAFVVRSGPSRQANLILQRPWKLSAGDILDIKVIHYNTAGTADFEATMLGV